MNPFPNEYVQYFVTDPCIYMCVVLGAVLENRNALTRTIYTLFHLVELATD